MIDKPRKHLFNVFEIEKLAGEMASCQAVCWEWQRDDGGFCPYVPEDSSKLELALASGTRQCQIDTYVVDFRKLVQCRKAGGGTLLVGILEVEIGNGPGRWSVSHPLWGCGKQDPHPSQ